MRIVHVVIAVSVFAAAGLGVSAARSQQTPKTGPSVIVYKSPT